MMDSRIIRITAVVLCCLAGVSSGAGFTWIASDCPGNDPCVWQVAANWDPDSIACSPCYPSTANDDARIPILESVSTIDQGDVDFTIDDLTFTSTAPRVVVFKGKATITVDTLVITGPTTGNTPLTVSCQNETILVAE